MFQKVLESYRLKPKWEMGHKYLPVLTDKWKTLCTKAMIADHFFSIKHFLSYFILSFWAAHTCHAIVALALRLKLFSTFMNKCLCPHIVLDSSKWKIIMTADCMNVLMKKSIYIFYKWAVHRSVMSDLRSGLPGGLRGPRGLKKFVRLKGMS
jgi:hypothetical protein